MTERWNTASDDRIGIVGTSGSGKTFTAGLLVEDLMAAGRRVIVVDPLGAWYGLRLMPDGVTPSPFNPVIFGGRHGDIAITESSGQIIGETVAGMSESCIIDLSSFSVSAVERRFMLAFLKALYQHNASSVHLVMDEADMWAPQVINDRDGDAARLLGMMETVVRRGRIKGFKPWLITQRPAVLNKNVLSQVDGLIAMKLTSSQDRAAIGAWVEGQADKGQWKELSAQLPTLKTGTGIVWMPARGVLETRTFRLKQTYDSSRTPKHGEVINAVALKPIDIAALQSRIATVDAEVKANDPKVLKAEIAKLQNEALLLKQAGGGSVDQAYKDGYATGSDHGHSRGYAEGSEDGYERGCARAETVLQEIESVIATHRRLSKPITPVQRDVTPVPPLPKPVAAPMAAGSKVDGRGRAPNKASPSPHAPSEAMPNPQRKLLTVLAQYPHGRTKKQLAVLAGYAHNGGAFNNPLSNLRSRGWATGSADNIAITDAGVQALGTWDPLPTGDALREYWYSNLDGPQAKLLRALCEVYPRGLSKANLAEACGYAASGGAFNNPLSRLRALELVTGRGGEEIRASADLFDGGSA